MVPPENVTDNNTTQRISVACWATTANYGYTHILRIPNTFCFSSATVVTRKRLIATFTCALPVLFRCLTRRYTNQRLRRIEHVSQTLSNVYSFVQLATLVYHNVKCDAMCQVFYLEWTWLSYAQTRDRLLTYLLTYLITYLLTRCNRVLLEKLTHFQLVNKFPAFYGTRRFITTFTSAHHLSLS